MPFVEELTGQDILVFVFPLHEAGQRTSSELRNVAAETICSASWIEDSIILQVKWKHWRAEERCQQFSHTRAFVLMDALLPQERLLPGH